MSHNYANETLNNILNKLKEHYKGQETIMITSYSLTSIFPQYTQKQIINILSRNKFLISNHQVRESRPSRKLLYHEYSIKI